MNEAWLWLWWSKERRVSESESGRGKWVVGLDEMK